MKKFLTSFKFAFSGIKECFINELNFKFHTIAAVIAILFSVIFKISKTEWLFVITSISMVISAEIANTIAECICDFVEKEKNDKIRIIKDMAAGMVLVSSIGAFIVACIIFIPKII